KVPNRSTRESVAVVPRLSTVCARRAMCSPPNHVAANAAQTNNLGTGARRPLARITAADTTIYVIAMYRPLSSVLGIGAVAALVVGWARPAPWLLAVLLVAVLSVLWAFAVLRSLSAAAW